MEASCAGGLTSMLLKSLIQIRVATGKMPVGDLRQFLICSQELLGVAQTGLGQTMPAPCSDIMVQTVMLQGPETAVFLLIM